MKIANVAAIIAVVLPATSAFIANIVTPYHVVASQSQQQQQQQQQRRRYSGLGALSMGEKSVDFGKLDGTPVRVGIIKTRWNDEIVGPLAEGVRSALKSCNVSEANTFETEVPGAFELPLAARFLASTNRVDTIVCLGCLIKGETMHFEYIADAVSKGLMNVGISTQVPVIFGVLTVLDKEQAVARSTGSNNHGIEWGKTAVEMGLLRLEALGMAKGGGAPLLGFAKDLSALGGGDGGDKKIGIGF